MLNANRLSTNLLVTALVAAMVFVLPWLDRRICRKLDLRPEGGISGNPRAESLLRLRQGLLLAAFGMYLAVMLYLVFFSREAASEYLVHADVFDGLYKSIRIDFGLLGTLRLLLTEGFQAAASHVRIVKIEGITQLYMNLMLFVPMGYLLPYLFRWFRAKPRFRPTAASFLVAVAIENIQLLTKLGFYDVDDLITNTLGGLIGALLFVRVAFVVTHPDWRREMRAYRKWKKNAKARTLYPFARRIGLSRTTLMATNVEAVYDFYIDKLGFRLRRQIAPEDSLETDFLLEMGKSQVEIRCSNRVEALKTQYLTISARRLPAIRERLEQNGIRTEPFDQDPYTGQRVLRFDGPDGVKITVIEG